MRGSYLILPQILKSRATALIIVAMVAIVGVCLVVVRRGRSVSLPVTIVVEATTILIRSPVMPPRGVKPPLVDGP